MSKEFRCNKCKKKIITERENTTHTEYSSGICEECIVEEEKVKPQLELETIFACPECPFIAKSEFGLKSHMRKHK